MDWNAIEPVVALVATACGAVAFWWVRSTNARISSAEKATTDLALHVAQAYAKSSTIDKVFEKLDKIYDMLSTKADKP